MINRDLLWKFELHFLYHVYTFTPSDLKEFGHFVWKEQIFTLSMKIEFDSLLFMSTYAVCVTRCMSNSAL